MHILSIVPIFLVSVCQQAKGCEERIKNRHSILAFINLTIVTQLLATEIKLVQTSLLRSHVTRLLILCQETLIVRSSTWYIN